MSSVALIGLKVTPRGLIGWQGALLFLIWKAKQRGMMDFFGVGRTIKRMIALPGYIVNNHIISAKLNPFQIMGLICYALFCSN